MKTERDQMETEFSERMQQSTSNSARNEQNKFIDDDMQVKLNNQLERVETL